VAAAAVAERGTVADGFAAAATWLGSTVGVGTLTVLVVMALAWGSSSGREVAARVAHSTAWVGTALLGSVTLTVVLKALVARHRPPTWMVSGPVDTGYAFPSGHTLNTTVLAGAAAWLAIRQVRSSGLRAGIVAAAAGLSVAVGVSRVYLGYHWLTDVIAGWIVAFGWLGVLFAGRAAWRRYITGRPAAVGR
jgi:undecaprenyl-diphosphatase